MNMISTGAFLNEMDASNKQPTAAEKFAAVWEKKNAKAARAGGVSLMALSLAACGSSSSDTSSSSGGSTPATTPTAQTLTLTSGVDTVAGGSGDDTINAGLDSSGNQTLTALDNISGGAGTDTMNVVMKANATPASTGVESYVVSTSAAATLDMLGSTGVTSITNKASTNTLTVKNISGDVALTLSSTDQGGTFNFDTAGAKAAQTVNVSSVTGGTLTVGTTGEVTLNSQGAANTVTLSSSATSLKVTGSEDLTLSGTTAQTTIDASGATGKFTVTSDNTKAVTITGSEGADTVTMTGSNTLTDTVSLGGGNDKVTFTATLDDADKVDGGDGTDTVVGISADLIALTTAATTSNLTNFEVVQVSDQLDGDINFSDDVQEDGLTTINLATSGEDLVDGTGRTITGEAGSLTVNLGKSAAGNSGSIGSNGTLTISDGADNKTTDDALTINNTAVNSTTGKNLDLDDSITSTGYELVTFNTGSGSGNEQQDIEVFTLTADVATAATSLTLKGNNSIDIATRVTTNSTSGVTVDASGMKAQAAGTTTFDIASAVVGTGGTVTITGSDGDDNIGANGAAVASVATTVNGGAGADAIYTGAKGDTINAGAGNDTINSGAGNDTIDGGAGNDTIDMSGVLTNKDSIDGGEGTDTLKVNNTDATTLNAYSLGQVAAMNANLAGIEKLDFGAASLAQAIDVGRLDGVSNVTMAGVASGAQITGLAADNAVEMTANGGNAITLALADATGTSDVLNLTLKKSGVLAADSVTVNGIETLNVNGIDASAAGTAAVNTITVVGDKLTKIVVTGNDGLNVTSTGATKITTFDASAVAGQDSSDDAAKTAVTYTSANTSATAEVTITGGEGNDTLEGNNGIDTITGGKGADAVVMTSGNDVVSLGDGADTFKVTEALLINHSETTSTVDGGAGTDILLFNEAAVINIVDADFRGMTSFETLTTGNGTNNVVLAAKADAVGFKTINGGTGADTIDISSVDFDNAVSITGGATGDVIKLAAGTAQVATLKFSASSNGDDTITGFTTGTDKIDVSALTFQASTIDGAVSGALTSYDTMAEIQAAAKYGVVIVTDTNINTAGLATALNASAFDTDADAAALYVMEDAANGEVELLYAVNDDTGNNDDVTVTEIASFTDIAAVASAFASGDFIVA